MKNLFFLIPFLTTYTLLGQSQEDSKSHNLNQLFESIEIIGGPSLNFPNDNGWSDYIYKGSLGQTIYTAKKKSGYFFGTNIIHSISKRFEIQARFAFEKRGYYESYETFDNNGNPYSKSTNEQNNNYLTFSLIPAIQLLKQNRLQIFSGFTYAYLSKSISFGETYVNGQYIGSASINTIDGFRRHVVDALAGVGYFFPLSEKLEAILRIQGNYGLSYTASQNNQSISINSMSLSLAIRYTRQPHK